MAGLYHDGAMHFVTGTEEQKARNLEHARKVALTTGTNTWNAGLDVVVEGDELVFGAGKAGRVIAWDRGTRQRRWATAVGLHRNDRGPRHL